MLNALSLLPLRALFSRAVSTYILPCSRTSSQPFTDNIHGWPFAQSRQVEHFCTTVDGRNLAPLCIIARVASSLPPSTPSFNIGCNLMLMSCVSSRQVDFSSSFIHASFPSILGQGVAGDGKGIAFNQRLTLGGGGARFRPSTVNMKLFFSFPKLRESS